MLELVHASSFHWKLVGGVRRWAVSDWQISRVYATLNQPMLAAQFARACLEKCREHRLSEVLPTAYEALARASAVAQDFKSARRYLSRARRLLDAAALNDADRAIYEGQIRSTQEMIP